MTRLITVEELKADGFINQNLENEYLYSAIDEAQDIFLREIIGDSLYETLQNKLSEANIDGVYQTLLDIYVKIYLKYKVLALLCVPLNFKLRNIGIAQQFSNEVNTTSLEDTKYIQNYYEGKADFYANRLTKFLQTNDIPEYKCSCNQITEPNELHPVSSIYLGNSKKRFLGSVSGSSGGGGGVVGDVVWGNIKGDITNQIDLQNELTIKVNREELSRVATTGSFNDLLDKPTIPTKTSELENDSGFLTEHQPLKTINNESIVGTGNIEISGFSGDYNDLTNKPSIPTKTSELTNDSGFLTEQTLKTINNESIVGTGNIEIGGGSGRNVWYGNQAQFDALSESELDENTDYYISGLIAWDDVAHPVIPTKTSELENDILFQTFNQVKSEIASSLKIYDKRVQYVSEEEYNAMEQAGSLHDGTTYFIEGEYVIPTKTSELTNDSGFLTEHQPLKTVNGESLVGTGNITIEGFSGDYNDLTNKPVIPTKTSELTNDSGFLTEHQPLKTVNGESLVGTGNITIEGFSGDYNDLTNKPTIPTKTSELTNDSGFLTEHQPLKTINGESLVGTGNIEISGFSGSYNDLTDKPNFSTVATTGSYNDLTDKPTIPSNTVEMIVEFADGTSTTYNVYIQ